MDMCDFCMVLSSSATAAESLLSCPCSHKNWVVVWYRLKCQIPLINDWMMACANIKKQVMHKIYKKICPVFVVLFSVAALMAGGLIIYNDNNFLSFSCLKHKKSNSTKAMSATIHDRNMNIIDDSASSSNQESMSRMFSLSSKLSIKLALSISFSLPSLSEFERYTLLSFRLVTKESSFCREIGGTFSSVKTLSDLVLITVNNGIDELLGSRNIC